ncbi:MAG: hypothetical protein IJL98_05510 [Lachnospiraceae bacterium]|nr:hypothetical protein [Lachnospiraceae bacterium]MBR0087178.1 hypothetical protein [Lachnospiraceae bacterium]
MKKHLFEMILILLAALFLTLGNAMNWQELEEGSPSDYVISAMDQPGAE